MQMLKRQLQYIVYSIRYSTVCTWLLVGHYVLNEYLTITQNKISTINNNNKNGTWLS